MSTDESAGCSSTPAPQRRLGLRRTPVLTAALVVVPRWPAWRGCCPRHCSLPCSAPRPGYTVRAGDGSPRARAGRRRSRHGVESGVPARHRSCYGTSPRAQRGPTSNSQLRRGLASADWFGTSFRDHQASDVLDEPFAVVESEVGALKDEAAQQAHDDPAPPLGPQASRHCRPQLTPAPEADDPPPRRARSNGQ
jgi:hypothetical protein